MNRIFGHDRDGSFPARPGLAVLFSWFVLTGSAAAEQGKEGWNVAETDHYTIHLQQTGSDRKSVRTNRGNIRRLGEELAARLAPALEDAGPIGLGQLEIRRTAAFDTGDVHSVLSYNMTAKKSCPNSISPGNPRLGSGNSSRALGTHGPAAQAVSTWSAALRWLAPPHAA